MGMASGHAPRPVSNEVGERVGSVVAGQAKVQRAGAGVEDYDVIVGGAVPSAALQVQKMYKLAVGVVLRHGHTC